MRHEDDLRLAEAHDHARAGERGERLRFIANEVISKLIAHNLIRTDARYARILAFHVLADWLHGNASIDIPPTLGEP
jgi:hypothetical protein